MNNQSVDASKKGEKRDPDLAAAEIAMKRAAHKARKRVMQMGSGVTVLKDGKNHCRTAGFIKANQRFLVGLPGTQQ